MNIIFLEAVRKYVFMRSSRTAIIAMNRAESLVTMLLKKPVLF